MGNTVLWKPAATRDALGALRACELLEEAGLPPGVINFVPGDAGAIATPCSAHRELAGVHFTGSTASSTRCGRRSARTSARYRNYPRLVGETGGKDFIVAHPSADPEALAIGDRARRLRVPGPEVLGGRRASTCRESLWPEVEASAASAMIARDQGRRRRATSRNFMGAVIDQQGVRRRSRGYAIAEARGRTRAIVAGGKCDGDDGLLRRSRRCVETTDPEYRLMCEEFFGPVVTRHVYADATWSETLALVDRDVAVRADRRRVRARSRARAARRTTALRYAAGNFYINDKPTGAVVGQQPFGGARASGTNDKAGSMRNLLRWIARARSRRRSCRRPTTATRSWRPSASPFRARSARSGRPAAGR